MSVMAVDPYQTDAERLFHRRERLPEQKGRSFSEQGNSQRLSTFLVIMSAVSLAMGIGQALIPVTALGAWSAVVGAIGTSIFGQFVTALIGLGLALCLTWGSRNPANRRDMLLAPCVAMGIGTIIACLGHLTGQMNAFGWLISPVYLLWAWGSAASGR